MLHQKSPIRSFSFKTDTATICNIPDIVKDNEIEPSINSLNESQFQIGDNAEFLPDSTI